MLKKITLSMFAIFATLATYAQDVLPEFSSEASPLWYLVQFKTGGNVLSDKGSGKNLQTATKAKSDANQWQFIGTADDMYMKSKSGNYIYYNGSKFAASGSSKTALKIVKSTNGAGGWEIQRKSGNGQSMNQWGGTSTGAELGEWSAGDNIVIDFTQTATGIAAVEEEKRSEGKIYDLNGRRVYNPTEGIYIKKGKKIFVK
jgi:hypothetical protein